MSTTSFRNDMIKSDSVDEPDETVFWQDVKLFPNRQKEMNCIDMTLKDRKKACLADHRRRSDSIEKEDAYSSLDRSLNERKNAFFSEADRCEMVHEDSSSIAAEDIDESLDERKNAFFKEAERCESVQGDSSLIAAEDIDETLDERKRAFFYDVECRNLKSSHSNTSDEIGTPLTDRKEAFFSDAKRCDLLRQNSTIMDNVDTPLTDRKAAFLNESKQNEIVKKDDTITDDIDRDEISYRRRSFFEKDLQHIRSETSTDTSQRLRHKVRRINSDSQLSALLQRRRALSQTDDEASGDDINNNNNNTSKTSSNNISYDTSHEIVDEFSKLMHEIDNEYGCKV